MLDSFFKASERPPSPRSQRQLTFSLHNNKFVPVYNILVFLHIYTLNLFVVSDMWYIIFQSGRMTAYHSLHNTYIT